MVDSIDFFFFRIHSFTFWIDFHLPFWANSYVAKRNIQNVIDSSAKAINVNISRFAGKANFLLLLLRLVPVFG